MLKLNPKLRQIIGNTGWLFSEKLLQMGLGLVVGVWVARYLGPEQFGLFNYAIAFVSMFNPLTTLGLDGIAVREIVRDPSSKDEILGTTLALRIISALLTLLLIVVISSLLRPDETLTRWLVVILAAGNIFKSFETINFWFQAQIQSKYTVVAKNLVYVFVTVLKIALIQMQAPLMAFACIKSAEIALNAAGLVVVYKLKGESIKTWQVSLARAKNMLGYSWMVMLAGVSTYIYASIDQVMLGQMATVKSLGIYSVAVKLSELFNFLPVLIAQSLLPVVTQKNQQGEDALLDTMQVVYDIMAILWFSIALLVSLSSHWIVVRLYGEDYSGSAIVLSVYIWSQFGSNFGVARSLYINVKNLFRLSLIITIVGGITNISLNYWLIPKYEEMGATWATLITYYIAVIGMNVFFRDLRKLLPLIWKSMIINKAVYRLLRYIKARSSEKKV